MKRIIITALALASTLFVDAQKQYNSPQTGNPIIAGYFADPTVKKFGDTYYLYSTTDGNGAGFGPAQVWTSKDFVNWTFMPMNWPDSHWIWAPDVLENDGNYYYYYCQPCNIYCGTSSTPRGPWKNILGQSESVLIPDRFVKNAITLDGQSFKDDDGSIYLYWGTWGIYKDFGCGCGKLSEDMKSFDTTRLIVNTEAVNFFEAPYVLKHNSKYYLFYSCDHCEDASYHVEYATADAPMGPYKYGGKVLTTNSDGTVHGPGHNSIIKEGNDYFIVYHRHNNPHSNRGFHRQICIDKLEFNPDGTVKPVVPTHDGHGYFATPQIKSENLALCKKIEASSFYNNDFKPEYAVDDNNGTLWKPATCGNEWITVDLGKTQNVKTVFTQFEYATRFYQYYIETSLDNKSWKMFADKRNNRLAGSPCVDFGNAKARFVRLVFTGGEKNGFRGAIWNIKIFNSVENSLPQQWLGLTAHDFDGKDWNNNEGMLGGKFVFTQGRGYISRVDGKDALVIEKGSVLKFENNEISSSGQYTASMHIFRDNKWQSIDCEKYISEKNITIKAETEMIVTNFRLYNRILAEQEKEFDSQSDITRNNVAPQIKDGLIVNIDAHDYNVNDTVGWIMNKGINGYFESQKDPCVIKEVEGKKGFEFTGKEFYQSSFALPSTIIDNAPYTLKAVIFNPEILENECVADFTSSHDELEKIMLVSGTEPRCGVINHYGWYEDAGYREMKSLQNKWYEIYVCFDGFYESIYINGTLISKKDLQLLVKPSQFIRLGLNNESAWPFSGYLNSLKLWDEYIPYNNN